MKIELLTSRSGVDFVQNKGDVIDIGDAEAQRMIDSGQAIPFTGNADLFSADKSSSIGQKITGALKKLTNKEQENSK